jgi:hypothetical protein
MKKTKKGIARKHFGQTRALLQNNEQIIQTISPEKGGEADEIHRIQCKKSCMFRSSKGFCGKKCSCVSCKAPLHRKPLVGEL